MTDTATFAQERTNCLAAKHLHAKALGKLRTMNRSVDYLAVAVPVLFFPIRYMFKATSYERLAEIGWEILATILLATVIYKMANRWQERSETHSKLLGQNISLARQAYALLQTVTVSSETAALFRSMASTLEQEDREALENVTADDKKFAYREALKEFQPGAAATTCPMCGASPWRFTAGECQLCGNTPIYPERPRR